MLELQCDTESIELPTAQRAMWSSVKAWDFAVMVIGMGTSMVAPITQAAIGLPLGALVLIALQTKQVRRITI